ncbi:hypothetical protein OESDEN_12781 [Oesophagostomum dentatum]|uniref:Uncharacterized protein n=1 Tax=Oesophagostomum dentatum TaxID=61180 RepID=A0A0B1SU74_OESDE|nr:hypothetical protein OESDEN_12781 [Oesophagostomum dentatum]
MLLKLVAGLFVFIIRAFAAFLPYCYLLRRSRNGEKRIISLSICNCVACGIFLSVCFLGLIPHVHQEENIIRLVLQKSILCLYAHMLIDCYLFF